MSHKAKKMFSSGITRYVHEPSLKLSLGIRF
jgi:hypothetical protein